MYGKVVNGKIVYAPENYERPDGVSIIGFNTSEELMRRYGYKEIVEHKVDYDPTVEELYIVDIKETINLIDVYYSARNKVTFIDVNLGDAYGRDETYNKTTIDEMINNLKDSIGDLKFNHDDIETILSDVVRRGDLLSDYSLITRTELTQILNGFKITVNNQEVDKNGIYSISTKYYLSTSKTELIGGSWLDNLPSASEQEGKYLWFKMVTTYNDPDKEPSETSPVCISAKDGVDGKDGIDGKDGTSINILGSLTSTSDLPESANPGDCYTIDGELYIWSSNTGTWENIGNIKGEPGHSSYLHIKYSDDGETFTTNEGETPGIYMGVLINNTEADSTNFNDYTWSRIRGDQGLQGLQGEKGEDGIKGEDGKTTYFHIKYSSVANPTSSSQITETPSEYIGTYVDYTSTDSTDPSKYKWSRFQGLQGEKGEDGIPGTNGTDGQTYYLHIKYSNDGGSTFTSNNGETPGTYIGVYTDTTKADSTSVSSYTWSKIKGEDAYTIILSPETIILNCDSDGNIL